MDTLLADAAHVVLIDRDPEARREVRDYLREHRLRVSEGASARELLALVGQDDVDLLLLDPQLPDDDGLLLARRLREQSDDLPIVLLTDRRDEAERVMGPTLAADDCIPKPSPPRDMLARLRAVLRRYQSQVLPSRDGRRAFRFAGWELNLRLRRLTAPTGRVVELAPSEFNLLQALCRAPQRVLTRDQLLTMSRLHETEVFDRVIDVQVRRLRVKLEVQPSRPTLIVTERGLGYRFACPVESVSG
jgi:DNA-binding response OmpR family regulator